VKDCFCETPLAEIPVAWNLFAESRTVTKRNPFPKEPG